MNGILTLTHNCFQLTRRAIESFQKQDIPVTIRAIDNGSTDGVKEWLEEFHFLLHAEPDNAGVSAGWNKGIEWFFQNGFRNVLVIGNDTWIPPYFYRELLSYNLPFITGVAVGSMEQVQPSPNKCPLDPHPDFSAFVMSFEIWQRVGWFDTRMKHYASDCDWHVRAFRKGYDLYKASCEFYHERSSTLKHATEKDAEEIQTQANRDRNVFHALYGCLPGDSQYEAIFRQSRDASKVQSPESHDNTSGTGTAPASHTSRDLAEVYFQSRDGLYRVSSKPDPERIDEPVALKPEDRS